MGKQGFQYLALIVLVGMLAGCSGTSSIRTRSYVTEKERVDQKMEGNFGYLLGEPKEEDRSEYKKTRKVYVLEFTKEPVEEEVEIVIPPRKKVRAPAVVATPSRRERQSEYDPIVIPNFDEEVVVEEEYEAQTYIEYTIQKNDTLQKVSKKFYDTYRKWPQIYEANKDVLKDPNSIKPGMTIVIPSE